MSIAGPLHASDLAFIVHRTPTRIRINIPGRRGQKSYFDALKPALLAHPDVLEVEAIPLTGSVIINCHAGFTLATPNQQFPQLFKIAPTAPLASVGLEHGKCVPQGPVGFATVATIAKALDLSLAIATNQLGSRLVEWAFQTLADVARGQVYPAELRQREALLLGIATQRDEVAGHHPRDGPYEFDIFRGEAWRREGVLAVNG